MISIRLKKIIQLNFLMELYEGKTKFIRKTIRGGQCINYPGNISYNW